VIVKEKKEDLEVESIQDLKDIIDQVLQNLIQVQEKVAEDIEDMIVRDIKSIVGEMILKKEKE